MLYAPEVIELMAAFPGRDFRIGDVIRYVRNGKDQTACQVRAMREAVVRVLAAFESTGGRGNDRLRSLCERGARAGEADACPVGTNGDQERRQDRDPSWDRAPGRRGDAEQDVRQLSQGVAAMPE